jgi:hypothetical protein
LPPRTLVIIQEESTPAAQRLLLTSCRLGWLHYVTHNVFTDLETHIRAGAS